MRLFGITEFPLQICSDKPRESGKYMNSVKSKNGGNRQNDRLTFGGNRQYAVNNLAEIGKILYLRYISITMEKNMILFKRKMYDRILK